MRENKVFSYEGPKPRKMTDEMSVILRGFGPFQTVLGLFTNARRWVRLILHHYTAAGSSFRLPVTNLASAWRLGALT